LSSCPVSKKIERKGAKVQRKKIIPLDSYPLAAVRDLLNLKCQFKVNLLPVSFIEDQSLIDLSLVNLIFDGERLMSGVGHSVE
jgi:hypothetical protein